MATRAVLQTFERYQKERVAFVTGVAEMAKNPQVRLCMGWPRGLGDRHGRPCSRSACTLHDAEH